MKKTQEKQLKERKVFNLLQKISSLLFFIPWILSAQAPVYYADTLSVGMMDRPVAMELHEDSLFYYDPVYKTFRQGYAYENGTDTLVIQQKSGSVIGIYSEEKDTIWCKFLGAELELKRTVAPTFVLRPQLPVGPFPYEEKEIKFKNFTDSISLRGALVLPSNYDKDTKCVILVAGSGNQDRDETIFNHKPFKVIADYLARHGVASLRYDKRGVGESEGVFSESSVYDFVADAHAAVNYLQNQFDFSSIGLLGHSEGGMVASQLCRDNADVDFYILLGAPSVKMDDLLYDQTKQILMANETPEKLLDATLEFNMETYQLMKEKIPMDSVNYYVDPLIDKFRSKLDSVDREKREYSKFYLRMAAAQGFYGNYMSSFINFPADKNFKYMKQPTLAIYGEKDLQVSPTLNGPALEKQLTEAPVEDFKIITLPDLNHLLQKSESGSPSEYAYISTTIDPEVLKLISDWIHNR